MSVLHKQRAALKAVSCLRPQRCTCPTAHLLLIYRNYLLSRGQRIHLGRRCVTVASFQTSGPLDDTHACSRHRRNDSLQLCRYRGECLTLTLLVEMLFNKHPKREINSVRFASFYIKLKINLRQRKKDQLTTMGKSRLLTVITTSRFLLRLRKQRDFSRFFVDLAVSSV